MLLLQTHRLLVVSVSSNSNDSHSKGEEYLVSLNSRATTTTGIIRPTSTAEPTPTAAATGWSFRTAEWSSTTTANDGSVWSTSSATAATATATTTTTAIHRLFGQFQQKPATGLFGQPQQQQANTGLFGQPGASREGSMRSIYHIGSRPIWIPSTTAAAAYFQFIWGSGTRCASGQQFVSRFPDLQSSIVEPRIARPRRPYHSIAILNSTISRMRLKRYSKK